MIVYHPLQYMTELKSITALTALTLLLGGCSQTDVRVFNRLGNSVGTVHVKDSENASVLVASGDTVGFIRGKIVRDKQNMRVGSIRKNSTTLILNRAGDIVGSLESGRECYAKDGEHLGTLTATIDNEAAGGACLLLLLE